MLKFAGWVILFALVFWVGEVGLAGGWFILGPEAPHWLLLGIMVGPSAWAFVVGYLASCASRRGPAMGLAVGVVAGVPYVFVPAMRADNSTLLTSWESALAALFWVAVLAMASGLGGLLHHWISVRGGSGKAAAA